MTSELEAEIKRFGRDLAKQFVSIERNAFYGDQDAKDRLKRMRVELNLIFKKYEERKAGSK
jgi:hypothetical protein